MTEEPQEASLGSLLQGVETIVTERLVHACAPPRASRRFRGSSVPHTVQAWSRRGAHIERPARPVVSQLDPCLAWIATRAPVVDFNATELNRGLCQKARVDVG